MLPCSPAHRSVKATMSVALLSSDPGVGAPSPDASTGGPVKESAGAQPSSGPKAEPGPSGATVLVADDDTAVRGLVAVLLRRAGYRVLQATTGREACQAVEQQGPELDAVLLDVMMPDMTGHDALPAIRDLCPALPVVFISGFDHNEVADHLANPSAYTSFMPKPFENAELLEEIDRAVHSSD